MWPSRHQEFERCADAAREVAGADFNQWRPSHEYDGVIASHVLHHVLNLEGLFAGIKESLRTGGCFAIADMIGRNGHQPSHPMPSQVVQFLSCWFVLRHSPLDLSYENDRSFI